MRLPPALPLWSVAAPVVGAACFAGTAFGWGTGYAPLMVLGLLGSVLAAVHHAEVVAHRVGEPFGTLVLAVAVTVIEVALIVSLMLAGGPAAAALARDTVFAAVMIILNGIVGLSLIVGGARFHEQTFTQRGVSASLATLAAIVVLTLVLPNYTVSAPGPAYNRSQLIFIAVVSLGLYGMFVLTQTVRHRDYFLAAPVTAGVVGDADAAGDAAIHAAPPSSRVALAAGALLVASLVAVVLLGKALAPDIERAVAALQAPKAVVGVIVAAVVLLPEALAALRAARANRLQTSLNLALGSALASIGLTIPAVAIVSIVTGLTLTLGIDAKSTVLLVLSLFVSGLSLGTGRTTVLQGAVLLVIFATYLFTTVVP